MTAPALRLPRRTAEEAIARWRRERSAIAAAAFSAKSMLSLSQWADERRFLSADLGEPGPWRTDRVPYMRRIMDAVTDPRVRDVSVMKSARIGATQAIVCNAIGYYIDEEPSPIIVALPTIDDATKFATQLLQPMLDDTPVLAGRVEAGKSRKRRNTMLQKYFPGGTVQILGTKSPRALRMVHGRIILMSEVDGYEHSAGVEGDPRKLLRKRAGTYGSPKFIEESTPLIKALSRIEPSFEAGSMEYYHVPCPHCGEFQRLVWGGKDSAHGIKWDNGDHRTAHYVCLHCGCVIDETEKHGMVAKGRWVATHPERVDHLSFHLNALVSPFDGARWALLVKEWLDAKRKPEQLRVFVNTVLGETWEDEGSSADASVLERRREPYPKRGEGVDAIELVPARVAVLTRSVDVQGDRIETAVWGWGAGEECFVVDYELIPGDPGTDAPWDALDAMVRQTYPHVTGAALRPSVTFVDANYHTKRVYEFTRKRQHLNVFACRGANTAGAPLLAKPTRNNSAKAILYNVGSFTGKEALLARLAKVTDEGPGYIHFPDWLDSEQIAQLTAEKLVTTLRGGRGTREWVKSRDRNEMTDLFVYGLAALQQLGPVIVQSLGAIADARIAKAAKATQPTSDGAPEQSSDEAPPSPPKPKRRPPRGGGWATGGGQWGKW